MVIDSKEFVAACESDGANLKPNAIKTHVGDAQRGLLYSIAQAGSTLRRKPTFAFAERTVNARDWPADSCAEIFRKIINASVEPVASSGQPSFESSCRKTFVGCVSADLRFARTFMAMREAEPSQPAYFEIVTDSQGPLFVRKSIGERSTISLRESIINGIPYPAGSLMYMELEGDDEADFPYDKPSLTTIHSIDDITAIAFMRPSAYAFNSEDRKILYDHPSTHVSATAEEQQFMAEATAEDLTAACYSAMVLNDFIAIDLQRIAA